MISQLGLRRPLVRNAWRLAEPVALPACASPLVPLALGAGGRMLSWTGAAWSLLALGCIKTLSPGILPLDLVCCRYLVFVCAQTDLF